MEKLSPQLRNWLSGMLQLPHDCRAGQVSVTPHNWRKVNANKNCTWKISYWFYDDNLKQKKKVVIKGLNHLGSLHEKQDAVPLLLEDEIREIKDMGYNRITQVYGGEEVDSEINPYTPFCKALDWAFENKVAEGPTKTDIKSALKYIKNGAVGMHMDHLPVSQLEKEHLIMILKKCGELKVKTDIPIGKTGKTKKGIWTPNQFNHYRKYLSALYCELEEVAAVKTNPLKDIRKQKHASAKRKILTPEECAIIDEYTKKHHFRFWILINIFFHSGGRTTELFRVQGKHVDLKRQTISYLIKKGKNPLWEEKPIKDEAVPFWEKAMTGCAHEDYVFSVGLKPGAAKISPRQAGLRWEKHIKKKLGITCDWYGLKHLHTDQVAALLTLKEAQVHNGQTNLTTAKIYAINEDMREMNRVKHLRNKFAG